MLYASVWACDFNAASIFSNKLVDSLYNLSSKNITEQNQKASSLFTRELWQKYQSQFMDLGYDKAIYANNLSISYSRLGLESVTPIDDLCVVNFLINGIFTTKEQTITQKLRLNFNLKSVGDSFVVEGFSVIKLGSPEVGRMVPECDEEKMNMKHKTKDKSAS